MERKNQQENNRQSHTKEKYQGFTWFDFWPTSTGGDGETFHYQIWRIQYGVEVLSKYPNPKYTQQLSLANSKEQNTILFHLFYFRALFLTHMRHTSPFLPLGTSLENQSSTFYMYVYIGESDLLISLQVLNVVFQCHQNS